MKRKIEVKRCSLQCIDARGKERFVPKGAKNPVCSVCRSNLGYWTRQPPAKRILRTSRVKLYVRRMEQLE